MAKRIAITDEYIVEQVTAVQRNRFNKTLAVTAGQLLTERLTQIEAMGDKDVGRILGGSMTLKQMIREERHRLQEETASIRAGLAAELQEKTATQIANLKAEIATLRKHLRMPPEKVLAARNAGAEL
jgi:ribosomal protein S15P/S13E